VFSRDRFEKLVGAYGTSLHARVGLLSTLVKGQIRMNALLLNNRPSTARAV